VVQAKDRENAMRQTYTGGCQCGKVRYEVTTEIDKVISCNCSRCARLGALLAAAPAADFKLISGEGEMSDFQFNHRTIHHYFCPVCGIQSFARGTGPGGAEMVMVNVRCLDGVDPQQFEVMTFDGRSL
jgi:hypothetical protein